jgi:hypothetical protein
MKHLKCFLKVLGLVIFFPAQYLLVTGWVLSHLVEVAGDLSGCFKSTLPDRLYGRVEAFDEWYKNL